MNDCVTADVPTVATPSSSTCVLDSLCFLVFVVFLRILWKNIPKEKINRFPNPHTKLSKSSHEFPNSKTPTSMQLSLGTLSKNKMEYLISSTI